MRSKRPFNRPRGRDLLAGATLACILLTAPAAAQLGGGGSCEADAGTLSGFKPTDCLQTGGTYIGGITNGDAVIPTGYQRIFVLTEGPDLVIQQTSNNPIFLVTAIGQYTVHTLVYDPNTLDLSIVVPGVTTGFDVNALLIQGGGDICASLDVTGTTILVDNPDAGGLAADAEEVCLDGGTAMLSATPDGNGYAPAGYETLYVLTSGSGLVIQDVSTAASFTVSDTGSYTIHTLVYDPNTLDLGVVTPGVTTGFDVNGLLLQGGGEICAALDVAGAPVDVVLCSTTCEADAGTLSGFKPTDCLQTGGTYIGGITNGDAVIPTGYQRIFVLTEGPDLVIQQTSNNPIFLVTAIGQYTVHTLVYDPNTLDLSIVVPGVTTGFDVNALLIQGGGDICASLDVTGTTILVDNPDAGGLAADAEEVCLDGGTAMLSATPDGNGYAPAGYETLYVLTSGSGLVIQDVSTAASFTVSDTGSYTIHTLVYDPNTLDLGVVTPGVTTGFDVNGLLLQGGGEICAALDVAGAPVDVVLCSTTCEADAGTITTDAFETCLTGGTATVSATPDGNSTVPAGYQTLYVLTEGAGLVIMQVDMSPSFEVTNEGSYTVHTLIYDPNTLDLSTVTPGVTTGFDVNGLLIQGGGSICASLDVSGAPTLVVDCPPTCPANAGTLTALADTVCLDGGIAEITVLPNGDQVVPAGFVPFYVLTSGPGLVIEAAGSSPLFQLTTPGDYTVHSLVYDPTTLDLSIVEPGVTTGFDVNALLIQGGGSICASLDVPGVPVVVEDCSPTCEADAGGLTADSEDVCLQGGGPVTISATPDGNSVVPPGYSEVYVLTSGTDLVIGSTNASPSFDVSGPGVHTIHTLVYDPNTLDLSIVVPGVTTGFEVNALLIQGGGSICASLDVLGAKVVVADPDAGTITADDATVCLDNATVTISATPDGNSVEPMFYQTVYVLTSGPDLVIQDAGAAPSFSVSDTGSYIIHTLVYDPNTLDLGIVEPGVTTGFDVNGLLVQGGGSICASLDVAGAPVSVIDCPNVDGQGTALAGAASVDAELSFWPNPASNELQVVLNNVPPGRVEVLVFDQMGRQAMTPMVFSVDGGLFRTTLDVEQLPTGMHHLVVSHAKGRISERFMTTD